MGDGGSGGDPQDQAQNINSLLGKMLRIDVNGTSSGRRTGSLDEPVRRQRPASTRSGRRPPNPVALVCSIGSPATSGSPTSALDGRREEINRSTAASGGGRGVNYGWDDMEGRHCYEPMTGCATAGAVLPIVEFAPRRSSSTDNCSVDRRLRLSRESAYRAAPRGGYFFADYCSNRIWVVDATGPLRRRALRPLPDTSLLLAP